MDPSRSANCAHTIPMVTKALDLVRLLASGGEGETTTRALASRLDLPRSSCYRILRSLIAQDWVRALDGGRHELSLGLLPLLSPLRRVEALADAVAPALQTLALRAQLTAKVSVRQGDAAVTVSRCESPLETSVAVRIGSSFHLAYGSSGTVLLSELGPQEVEAILDQAPADCWLHQDREAVSQRLHELGAKGWCCDLGTFRARVHAVSAPVRGADGSIAAAVTVIGFPQEVTRERLPSIGQAVLEAAREASRALQRRKR